MNSEELRRLEPTEMLDHLERTVQAARTAFKAGMMRVAHKTPRGFNLPLCQLGDFEVWPRNDRTDRRCHQCGSPTIGMMSVRGPMAFTEDAPERTFCSLHCFWQWIHQEQEERNAGGLISGDRKWQGPAGVKN